uniref:BTB domain-containing protein n=1 Tax=Panagrolaimus sp. ES5 TaxID=591445 RepID=A0AC34FM50_9BILA
MARTLQAYRKKTAEKRRIASEPDEEPTTLSPPQQTPRKRGRPSNAARRSSQNESKNASLIEDVAIEMKDNEQESQPPQSTKWYEIMSNEKFADLILISSDNVNVSSHRNVLSKYSPVFADLIEKATELPVTLDVENFDAATIQAALGFLYDKADAIDGKETAVFKFALHYGIKELNDICSSFFAKSVDPTNVCEYIQIACSNNLEELKKKCFKVLFEKKTEIDASKWNDLPKEIIIEAFCF